MNQTAIFWPMLAQVLLIYIVYGVIARRRHAAVTAGSVKLGHFRTRAVEPSESATAAANLMNQFELPVLFFTLCLALYVTNAVNYVTLVLMWAFVAARYAHAAIHLTVNRVSLRFRAFGFGLVVLAAGWVWFALHLAGAI